jgi:ribulose-phosphate 3-epimerase
MLKIVPSILTDDPSELKEMIGRVEGIVERVQIDIIDGVYADNKTIDPMAMSYIDTNLLIDYQLMVKEPINWIEKCVRAQADRIIGHIEMMKSQYEFVGKVQSLGFKPGLGIDLDTPIQQLDESLLNDLDVVLVMSVKAGFGGQEFKRSVFEKIKELDEIRSSDDTPFKICDDGGVTTKVVRDLKLAGADEVSVGRRLFDGNVKGNVKEFIKKSYK